MRRINSTASKQLCSLYRSYRIKQNTEFLRLIDRKQNLYVYKQIKKKNVSSR